MTGLLPPLPPGEGWGEGSGKRRPIQRKNNPAHAKDSACGFPHPNPLPEGEGAA